MHAAGELPEGWVATTLGEVVSPSTEKIEPAGAPDVPYLGLEHIERDSGRVIGQGRSSDVKSTKTVFRTGDVLYGKLRPYLNKVCIAPFDGICSTDILVFPRSEAVDSNYLRCFLSRREVVEFANDRMTGVELPRISFQKLAELPFPLPPLGEQRRIGRAVRELFTRIDEAQKRLARVAELMTRFRQSVLAAACSGRLTEDWREANQGTVVAVGAPPMDSQADGVPDSWIRTSLGSLSNHMTSGSRDWTKYYGRGSATFIMAQNVRPGRLDLTHHQAVDPPLGSKDTDRTRVKRGDLLITIVGANTGDVCPVTTELSEHYVCQSVVIVRPISSDLTPYLNLFLNSEQHGRLQFSEFLYGAGRPHLSFDQIKMINVDLPTRAERLEIVRRVEALFRLADEIECRVGTASARVETMAQAILAKAFRGELVPTEAELAKSGGREYEPAEDLLDRVRTEPAKSERIPRRPKDDGGVPLQSNLFVAGGRSQDGSPSR